MKNFKILIPFLLFSFSVFAQNPMLYSNNKKAMKAYNTGLSMYSGRNFVEAKAQFNKAIKIDPEFVSAHVYLSKLYKQIYFDKDAWIHHVEIAAKLAPNARDLMGIYFDLGKFYFQEQKYDEAIPYIDLVIKMNPRRVEVLREAEMLKIETKYGIEAMKTPLNFKVSKLASEINYFQGNYLPSVTADNSTFLYTGLSINFKTGYRNEDIMVSNKVDGKWSKSVSISNNINTREHNEGGSFISGDGRTLVYTNCNTTEGFGSCDLYISYKKEGNWTTPRNLGESVNTKNWDSQPTLSTDGRTLYFVSDRRGGVGGLDIWISTKVNDTTWTKAKNIGYPINTLHDEVSPFIHADGRTLYFSSKGFFEQNMGGYDLFKCDLYNKKEVENLGYPINTAKDESTLFITADAKIGYFAKDEAIDVRNSLTFIYEFEVPEEIKPELDVNFAKGEVFDIETNEKLEASVEVYELKTNNLVQQGNSDKIDGSFLITLNENTEYAVYVSKKGYLYESVNFNYTDNSDLKPEQLRIGLKKIKKGQSIVLNNIFFETASYELDKKSKSELDILVSLLNDNPNIKVEVSGHTDDVGSDAANLALSNNRAKSVKTYLSNNGISASRMISKGYGETKPKVENSSDENRATNRRIEFKIL